MICERLFLGWDQPILHGVVRVLRERYACDGFWDLDGLIVAVPVGRAGRRLVELLTQAAANNGSGEPCVRRACVRPAPLALTLPRIVTAGGLPEELYTCDEPVADGLTSLLALAAALRGLERERLAPLIGHPPDSESLLEWAALARDLERLRAELASEGMRVADAAQRCRDLPEFRDGARWEILCAIEEAYREILSREGLVDRHEARFRALEGGALDGSRPILLVGTVELPRITREMLARSGAPVTALIPAPEEEADGFDDLGCLIAGVWSEKHLPLADDALRIVDRPADQALALLDALANLEGEHTPEEITVGVGDESMAPALERALGLSGVPVRSILGRSLAATRPARLLGALRDHLSERRAEDLAALLRHPDLEAYLHRDSKGSGGDAHTWKCLSALDDYVAEHLPTRLDPRTGEGIPREVAVALHQIETLTASLRGGPRPLPEWTPLLLDVLRQVYGPLPLDPGKPEDDQLIRALRAVADVLDAQGSLPADSPLIPNVSLSEAISFALGQLSGEMLPLESDVPAVELLNWLELALDDAPVLLVTGVNEGSIPESVSVDPFLPDALRRALGLMDNRRRYARDVLLMTVVLRTRARVTLIAGRRGAEGDPLTPSRLLFACDEETLVRRARAFLGGEETVLPARALLPAGEKSRFWTPRPARCGRATEPIGELAVTAFASYLSCPYRFYLSRILRLREAAEEVEEMSALHFGSLLHETLQSLALGEARDSTDAEEIAAFLETELEARVRERFGDEPSPAVRLQQGQAVRRLRSFARWQARHAAEGWRMRTDLAEKDLRAELDVDGEAFVLKGRIDRVDEHPDGRVLLLDYKTGDTARTPERTHGVGKAGDGEWVDLQLPLYRLLVKDEGLVGDGVRLGYVNIPKEAVEEPLAPAPWGDAEIESAVETAHEVIRSIREWAFWPPGPASPYGDALSRICFDNCPNRAELLGNEPPAAGEGGAQ